MAAPTTQFDLDRARDLRGRGLHVWYRRTGLAAMVAFVAVALSGGFGQREHTRTVVSPAATLAVRAPETIRGGLMWPARIELRATRKLVAPTVVLGDGFIRGMQLNSLEPAPTAETSRRGAGGRRSLALTYPTLEAGDTLTVWLQLQVNPTTVGEQDLAVSLESAGAPPVRSPATLTVLP